MENKGTIIRSIEEITISARIHSQGVAMNMIQAGRDFIEAKEQLGHGKFLPWLKQFGISHSRAENWMKAARNYEPGGWMEGLQFSKILALLEAPA